jgi:hypothetical protein
MTARGRSAVARGERCIRRGSRKLGSSRSGLSLVEVSIAVVLLTIALCGITGSIVASDELQNVNRETALAEAGARGMIETLHGVAFAEVFARYNSNLLDNPMNGASPGPNFAVRGLQAAPGDPDGLPGEIIFPTTTVAGVPQLREDVAFTSLGMPRDLNGDGRIDALNHANDYKILPVRVRVRWSGATGVRTLDAETVLCAR